MPKEKVAGGLFTIPIPFDTTPELGDGVADFAFCVVISVKILSRGQQALDEKCGFHQVAAIVVSAEVRCAAAGQPIEEMRPGAVKAIGFAQKPRNFEQPFGTRFSYDEVALSSGDQRHDTEPGGADRNKIFITRRYL